jgi:hypothetical protein
MQFFAFFMTSGTLNLRRFYHVTWLIQHLEDAFQVEDLTYEYKSAPNLSTRLVFPQTKNIAN